ncbi:MAG TPA: ribokinase [Clostridiaceae bacterium]|nr:ribokinase [Clostridiaceae bacterium]
MKNVCVLGSINMDVVLGVNKIPRLGETVLSNGVKKNPGGKGANQAVAAARLGANVFMIGKVGRDSNGDHLVKKLKADGINTDHVGIEADKPTGTAIIAVDCEGNNSIIVDPGSNMSIDENEIDAAESIIKSSDIIVAQFETPIPATLRAFKIAKENNVFTLLNPAPVSHVPDELFKFTDLIVPNETEAEALTGIAVKDMDSAKRAAAEFQRYGVEYVVITLGSRGAAIISKDKAEIIDAYKVKAVDTTAAGDAFIGACASRLCKYKCLKYEYVKDAVVFGNKVSSIAVQRHGAQPSLPFIDEVI